MRVAVLLVATGFAGCSPSTDPIPPKSDKPAAWLEVFNMAGEWERVALVYGYWDDYEACTDMVGALMAKFNREYRCVLTN